MMHQVDDRQVWYAYVLLSSLSCLREPHCCHGKEHNLDDFNPYSSSSTVWTSTAPGWYETTCVQIHAACSCCIAPADRCDGWRTSGSTAARQRTARIYHTCMALPAAAGRDWDAGCSVLFALALQLCAVTCIWVLCRTKQNSNNNRYQ